MSRDRPLRLLDADLDQQSRHLLDRAETETGDTLGSPDRLVVPASSAGFRITAAATPNDCIIGTGHGYLDGWLVENTLTGARLTTQAAGRALVDWQVFPFAPKNGWEAAAPT